MGMPEINLCTITREDAVGDLIESIAMQESSLAHILNAESEKIEAVANMAELSPQQLIAVNRSVKNTIDTVIRLESALAAKLSLFGCVVCKTT